MALLKFYALFMQQRSQDMNINSSLSFPQMSCGVWYAETSPPPTGSEEEEDEEEGVCVCSSWLPSSLMDFVLQKGRRAEKSPETESLRPLPPDLFTRTSCVTFPCTVWAGLVAMPTAGISQPSLLENLQTFFLSGQINYWDWIHAVLQAPSWRVLQKLSFSGSFSHPDSFTTRVRRIWTAGRINWTVAKPHIWRRRGGILWTRMILYTEILFLSIF